MRPSCPSFVVSRLPGPVGGFSPPAQMAVAKVRDFIRMLRTARLYRVNIPKEACRDLPMGP
jgi:hypothetical protein